MSSHTVLSRFICVALGVCWKELIRLLSTEGQPTKAVLVPTSLLVFFIRSVSDTIFKILFLLKLFVDNLANYSLPSTG
jgi:hypothetical protein